MPTSTLQCFHKKNFSKNEKNKKNSKNETFQVHHPNRNKISQGSIRVQIKIHINSVSGE